MCEYEVGRTGLEPVTSALSKQRSEPTELTSRVGKFKQFSTILKSLYKLSYIYFINYKYESLPGNNKF